MQKLSRTDKYREYRNKLNIDGEREIATKEIRELQEKIIFNEKRFGNSSRTEADLSKGRKNISGFNDFGISKQSSSNSNDLDDIFAELNRYKKYSPSQKNETTEERDDYINKIKDIVHKANVQEEEIEQSKKEEINHTNDFEKILLKDEIILPEEPVIEEQVMHNEDPFVESLPIIEEDNKKENQVDNNFVEDIHFPDQEDDNLAEFIDSSKVEELPKSQLDNVEITKADIQPTIPQHDHSKEFEEICMNVNSLAEEIDAADSFGKDQYKPPVKNSGSSNVVEKMQQDIKKDLIGAETDNSFFANLENELNQFNEGSKVSQKLPEEKKKVIKKSEISNEMKEEYDNTVSLQVDKLMGEINSSKADNISAVDIIKGNDIAKKDINDHPGKTIAFEINKKAEVPDNTIVLSNPAIEDSSIHTMSFKTEELDVEDDEKGNTILNIVLSVLIVILVGLLGVIIYFFLITRGII